MVEDNAGRRDEAEAPDPCPVMDDPENSREAKLNSPWLIKIIKRLQFQLRPCETQVFMFGRTTNVLHFFTDINLFGMEFSLSSCTTLDKLINYMLIPFFNTSTFFESFVFTPLG